jgi:hypothetical protein
MQMFEDGIRSTGAEETMRAQDIAELMAQSLPQPENTSDS